MHVKQLFDLSDRVAVITGAGNGLGYEFAEAMAEAGADIDEAGNERTAARVRALGRRALTVRCDVTVEADVAALFQQADQDFGRVDITFANAGIADPAPQPLHDYPTADWNRVLAVNLQGVFFTDREALRIMGRVAEASERKGTALYLASDASSFTTGLMLVSDGGCTAK